MMAYLLVPSAVGNQQKGGTRREIHRGRFLQGARGCSLTYTGSTLFWKERGRTAKDGRKGNAQIFGDALTPHAVSTSTVVWRKGNMKHAQPPLTYRGPVTMDDQQAGTRATAPTIISPTLLAILYQRGCAYYLPWLATTNPSETPIIPPTNTALASSWTPCNFLSRIDFPTLLPSSHNG